MTCIWQGLRLEVPAEWEILRFRKDHAAGFLLWAGRYGYRFQLSWQRGSSARDADEVCADFIGKARLDGVAGKTRRLAGRRWAGVETRHPDRREWRFFQLLTPGRCLLEAVFVDADQEEPAQVDSILGSIGAAEPGLDGALPWRVFGMDLEVPKGFPVARCDILPASATLVFREGGEQPLELTFSRVGMVPHWLKGNLQGWWDARWKDRGSRIRVAKAVDTGWGTVLLEERHMLPEGAFRRVRPVCRLYSCLWIDPRDGRLHRHSVGCSGRGRTVDPGGVGSLACNGNLSTRALMEEHLNG